ncbi:polymerase [Alicyclobacillus ferrooxydans]|uniref:Polymerase n=1 Tax=Alicyclobacillus ferrooxydans TaxID=471514 RepID=A0A0P9C7J4_9BACL|nr:polymerase [Alicyclobacillus ferrooxydans]
MQSVSRGGLAANRMARWSVYAITFFPLIDFGLRNLPHLHIIGSIWSILALLVLAWQALRKLLAGHSAPRFGWYKFAGWYMIYGLALMFASFNQPTIAFDGYRADVFYMLFAFLIPFVVEPEDVPKLFHAIVALAILVGVHGLFQYVIAVPIPKGWTDVNEHLRTRVFSIITSPNELGAYMALTEPLLVGLFLYERNRWRKWMYGIGFFMCFGTHLFTYDRGSLLALGLALVIVAALVNRKFLIVVLFLGVVAFFLPPIHHRFVDLFSPVYLLKAQQGGRLERWGIAFNLMSANPLFGAGMGHYGGQVASDFGLGIYSDNYYMKVLGESGLIGLVLFMAMHLALLREVFKKTVKRMEGRNRYVAIGAFIGLVAIVIHNGVENVFEFGPNTVLYFTVATLLLIWGKGVAKTDPPASSVQNEGILTE